MQKFGVLYQHVSPEHGVVLDRVGVRPEVLLGHVNGSVVTEEARRDGASRATRARDHDRDALERRGMGTKVDDGVLYGDGVAPHPAGVLAGLANVTGTTLREAAVKGAADIMGSGGTPDLLAVTPQMWAAEMSRETASGPVFNGTDLNILGLRVVVVPKLHAGGRRRRGHEPLLRRGAFRPAHRGQPAVRHGLDPRRHAGAACLGG